MSKSHVYYYLDVRRPTRDKRYPLKIVIQHIKQSYISTGFSFTKEEWVTVQDRTIRKNSYFDSSSNSNDSEKVLADIRSELDSKFNKVKDTLERFTDRDLPFEAKDVKEMLSRNVYSKSELRLVYNCHNEYISNCETDNTAPKTISGYKSIMSVLKDYYESLSKRNKIDNLRFVEVDFTFLNQYEQYLIQKGDSPSTISAHHRYIRVLFNYAITNGSVPAEAYPYGKGEKHITIHSTVKTKKALSIDDVKKLVEYRTTKMPKRQWRNVDLALLSFLLNGANMIDIAELTYGDNYDEGSNTIHFTRRKTKNSSITSKEITINITKAIRWMINTYGNPKASNNYIFDLLRPVDDTPEKKSLRVHYITRAIDRTLKNVAGKIGIRTDISYQFFRHTHATFVLRGGGGDNLDVMESMGHKDIKTSSLYVSTLPKGEPAYSKKKQKLFDGLYE